MFNKHGGYYGKNEAVIDYSININPLGVSKLLKKRLIEKIDDLDRYPEIYGETAIEELSQKVEIPRENLILGNGATELIYLFTKALNIKKAVVVEPTFTEYEKAVILNNGKVFKYSYEEKEHSFELKTEDFKKYIEDTDAEAIYICNPNNPTGEYIEIKDMIKILEFCKDKKIFLFIDESFMDFVLDGESVKTLIYKYDIFILKSITKVYGVPGIRIGYGIGSEKIVEKLMNKKEPWTTNELALETLKMYLKDTEYRKRTQQWLEEDIKSFISELKKINRLKVYKTDVNFVLCRIETNGYTLREKLKNRNFYIRVCDDFYGLGKNYIRLAIRKKEDNVKLIKELKKHI